MTSGQSSGDIVRKFHEAQTKRDGAAVMDALASAGVRHIDTPLTPEKVWAALRGVGGRGWTAVLWLDNRNRYRPKSWRIARHFGAGLS